KKIASGVIVLGLSIFAVNPVALAQPQRPSLSLDAKAKVHKLEVEVATRLPANTGDDSGDIPPGDIGGGNGAGDPGDDIGGDPGEENGGGNNDDGGGN